MKKFWTKFRIMKMLNFSARTFEEFCAIFPQGELCIALKELKEDSYIRDNSPNDLLGNEFFRMNRKSFRKFLTDSPVFYLSVIASALTIFAFLL